MADAAVLSGLLHPATRPVGSTRRKRAHVRFGLHGDNRHVLHPELFADVLIREQRRAERFDERFVLVLVRINSGHDAASRVVRAVAAATAETDVLGWLATGTVLGVVAPEIQGRDVSVAPQLRCRILRELSKRVDDAALAAVSIESHVYPPHAQAASRSHPPINPWLPDVGLQRDAIKRIMDIAGGMLLLLILSPVFLLIAAALKLTSPGPILFPQERIGFMARPFTMWKFRTMRVDADPGPHHEFVTKFIRSGAQLHPAGRRALFKLTNDDRVTPLGRILRKTSLDELPQLWNVLRGDMSLVGPRPPLAYEVEHYKPWHRRRMLDAIPGMTGLWQVVGRSRTTFDEMVRLDLRYARTRSLWMDIKILLATPRAVISGKGAE